MGRHRSARREEKSNPIRPDFVEPPREVEMQEDEEEETSPEGEDAVTTVFCGKPPECPTEPQTSTKRRSAELGERGEC